MMDDRPGCLSRGYLKFFLLGWLYDWLRIRLVMAGGCIGCRLWDNPADPDDHCSIIHHF